MYVYVYIYIFMYSDILYIYIYIYIYSSPPKNYGWLLFFQEVLLVSSEYALENYNNVCEDYEEFAEISIFHFICKVYAGKH